MLVEPLNAHEAVVFRRQRAEAAVASAGVTLSSSATSRSSFASKMASFMQIK